MPNFGAILSNIGVPLANTVAANNFAQTAERDKQRAQAIQDVMMQRSADQADQQRRIGQSTIDLNTAHAKSLDEGAWGNAFPAVDKDGNPVLVQQHKQTGELRQANIGGGSPPTIAPPPVGAVPPSVVKGAPPGFVPPAMRAPSGVTSLAGVGDSQDMTGGDSATAPTPPPQAQQQGAPPVPPTAPPQSGGTLRPYVKPPAPIIIDPHKSQAEIPGTPEWQAAEKFKANLIPRDDKTLVQVSVDDGQGGKRTIYVPRSQAAGMETPAKAGAAATSGQTMQTMARMGTSYNDLKQAVDQMDKYENTPGNLAKQTVGKQMLGSASEMHPSQDSHGLTSGISNALASGISAAAQQKLGADDPEYRTYLNNKQRVATAFTELLPRPNQQLLQLEKGLSGADIGWNPQLMANIQARRRGGLDVLKNILNESGMLDANGNVTGKKSSGGRGGQSPIPTNGPSGPIDLRTPSVASPPTREQQLWDAAVQLHGQAKVVQEYGPRPGGEEE